MAVNGGNDVIKSPDIPSITILDSDDEQEQTTDELFEGFIKAVKPFLERKELLLLRVKFQAVSSDFKCSPRFKDMLRRKANQVHKVDVYIHFNEVLDAIIHNAAVYGNKRPKKTQGKDLSANDADDTGNTSVSLGEGGQMPRHGILAGNFESTNGENINNSTPLNQSSESADTDVQFVQETTPGNSTSSSSNNKRIIEKERMKRKRKKLIIKLEDKLKYISDEIKKFSQSELSLDEMDDKNSSYIVESRLKKSFNITWNKICKLKGRPTNTGRVVEGSIKCKSTGFPVIDRAIAKFLKKQKGFPDIFDIRNIVIRVNKKRSLGLTQVVQNDIAADILTDIGNKLQKKRKKDFEYNFGCHLTDDCLPSLDPALHNPNLLQKLEENKRVNQNALDDVFQKYVHLGRVKGPRNHGTDSNTTSESNSESEQESTRPGKRKAKKECESTSEDYSEEESPKKRYKKMKNSSKNKKAKISVMMSETSATDMSSPSTRSSLVEAKNSDSKDENNSSEEQAMIIDDEMPGWNGLLEFELAEPQNKSESEQGASQDVSVVNERIKKMKDAPLTIDTVGSARREPHIQASSLQITESNGNVKAVHGQINGFVPGEDNDVIEIIDNGEESAEGLNTREEIETVKNLPKQKPTISKTKLLVKIEELRENQLSKFNVYKPCTNSSISGESRKVESCHSKRKATSVRHITHNQEHPNTSLSNGHRNIQVQDSNENEEQRSESVLKAPSTSKTSDLSPQKQTSSFQESIKHSPSTNLKNNLVSQNSIHSVEQNPRFSYIQERRSSSPKTRLSTMSSKVVNGKVSKPVQTVIILSDDEGD